MSLENPKIIIDPQRIRRYSLTKREIEIILDASRIIARNEFILAHEGVES